MNRKKLLYFIIPVVVVLLLLLLNLFVKNKIEGRLQELDSEISYEDLGVNIYLNRYRLQELHTRQDQFDITAKTVTLRGISYSKLLLDGALEIDRLEVLKPEIIQFKNEKAGEKDSSGREVKIKEILLKDGNFSSKENDTAKASLYLSFPLAKLKPGNKGLASFQPESYRVELDSVYLKMNEEHFIDVGAVEADNGRVQIKDFSINPLYPRHEFDRKISYEKDHINLKISRISFNDLSVQRLNDTLYVWEPKMLISEAFLEIYRNKLLPDDNSRKPLYNELLREAPIKLNFEQIRVGESEIIYEEQAQEGREPAVIRFTGIEGEINNLNNIRDSLPQPEISARANFMRGTLVSLDWTFPVFDKLNPFEISGEFGKISGEALDPFIIPAINVRARGNINNISFNFYGNDDVLEGDFAMEYESLKVELLKDDGTEKKSVLSFLANLLVENEGEAGIQENRIQVERVKNRSFWNYLWLGLRKGFIETVEQF